MGIGVDAGVTLVSYVPGYAYILYIMHACVYFQYPDTTALLSIAEIMCSPI